METSVTPFDRLGGAEGVDRLISGFYDSVMQDPQLRPFFEHADMGHLLHMQREYVATALGGTQQEAPQTLRSAHAGRGIKARHYVRFLELFLAALRGAGLQEAEIDRVLDRMALAAPDILDETPSSE